jgi:hypothetical protein
MVQANHAPRFQRQLIRVKMTSEKLPLSKIDTSALLYAKKSIGIAIKTHKKIITDFESDLKKVQDELSSREHTDTEVLEDEEE